jgi:SAM-dependent methyltransferase
MGAGQIIGRIAKRIDRQFGILGWMNGDPIQPPGGFDVRGEKILDWAWITVNLPSGSRRALEIGPGESPIIPAMLALDYEVTAVDQCVDLSKVIANFRLLIGDFNEIHFDSAFDIIVLCSVVEHIGLSGRYNSKEDQDGDLKAMRKVAGLLNPDGLLFLTIPVGSDVVHRPWHRVYGRKRFPALLESFEIVKSRFLIKEPWGAWRESGREAALDVPVDIRRYALGEMILRKRGA